MTQPYLTDVSAKLVSGVSGAGSFVVPAGKILVIETVAIDLQIPANQQVLFATMSVACGARKISFPIPMQPIGTISRPGAAAETHYSGLHAVRIPAGPGSEVQFTIGRNSELGAPHSTCSVAGDLIDAEQR